MNKKIIMLPNGSLGIEFTKDEVLQHGLVIGDTIDLSDIFVIGEDDEEH